MLSHSSRQLLKELLIQIGQQEKQLEVVRQVVCEQPEFEPYAAFRRIDRARKGFINSIDILEFLLSNEFNFSEEECCYYINHYDRDFDNKLAYSEFLPSLLPYDNPDLRTLVTQRKVYDIAHNEFLPYEVEYALARVIAQEINFYKELEGLKNELVNEYDFTFFDAFASIDIYETGFIDYNLLKNFLKEAGKLPKEEQIIETLRRIDKDDDGRIKYEEFVEAIQPVAPGLGHSKTKKGFQVSAKSRQHAASFYASSKKDQDYGISKRTFKSPVRTTSPERKKNLKMKSTSPVKQFSTTTERLGRVERKPSEEAPLGKESRLSKSTQKKPRSKTPKKTTKKTPKTLKETDPLSNLTLIFKELINLEREVEFAKQDLALRSDFNLFDAFRIFDKKGKGIITVREFEFTFQELEMYPAKEDLYLLVKRLDRDGDGKLKFVEFCAGFAPTQKEYYDLVKGRAPVNGDLHYSVKTLFDEQTKKLFKRLLVLYLENEAVVEALRQKLSKDKAFNIRESFEIMDMDGDGYLTTYELREVMDMNDIFVTEKDVEYLINRFDKDDKQKISYAEFVQEITPKSQKKY